MVAVTIYALVAIVNTDCMVHGIYSLRTGDYVYTAMNFITFVMAFVALFRKGSK